MDSPEAVAKRVRGVVGIGLLMAAVATLLWACLQPPLSLGSGPNDGGLDGSPLVTEAGAPAILGMFTISGCTDLSFPNGDPLCTGTAPLKVQLILLAVGATTHRFQVMRATTVPDGGSGGDGGLAIGDGGGMNDAGAVPPPDGGNDSGSDGGSGSLLDDPTSRSDAPTLTLTTPGTYLVSLGVAGPGGSAAAAGTIIVQPAGIGGACDADVECGSGLRCLCGHGEKDGTCPAGLSAGLCTQSCNGTVCPTGSVCIDLSRSAVPPNADGGAAQDTWRQPICVPPCTSDASCRGDLLCRELPLLSPGALAGGAYAWGQACFIDTPGGVGESCISGDEQPDPSACAFGLCDTLGLRDVCTATCDAGCSSDAACAVFNGPAPPAPPTPRCLATCDSMRTCDDPLLECLAGGASGTLGFTLPGSPNGTMVCAPRHCTAPSDCPGGQCVALGAASFCTR